MAREDEALLEPQAFTPQQPYIPEIDTEETYEEDKSLLEQDDISEFAPAHREPFVGLLHLGHLRKTENILGHSFKLESPSVREQLEAGLLHKKYVNSLATGPAWQAITVAMYLRAVDGTPLPEPLGPGSTGVEERYEWILDNLYDPVIARVFEKCTDLATQVEEALDELERVAK